MEHRLEQPIQLEIRRRYIDPGHCKFTTDLAIRIVRGVLHSYVEPGLSLMSQLDAHESVVFLRENASNVLAQLYYLKRKAVQPSASLPCRRIFILNCLRGGKASSPRWQDLLVKVITIYDQL